MRWNQAASLSEYPNMSLKSSILKKVEGTMPSIKEIEDKLMVKLTAKFSFMEEYKLSDIAEVRTGPFGSQLHNEDYVSTGTPIVTVEHLGNRRFSKQNLPLVSDDDKKRLSKYLLQEGDIVFSRVGSVDRCSYVTSAENDWLFFW